MPFILIIIIIALSALSILLFIVNEAPKGLYVVVPILFCSTLWISVAHCSRKIDSNKETFNTIIVDVQDDVDAQCIRVLYDGKVKLVNMNDKFKGIIRKDTIVRRYCLEMWKYGIGFIECETDYKYELINLGDERHKKINKMLEEKELGRLEKAWQVDIGS